MVNIKLKVSFEVREISYPQPMDGAHMWIIKYEK